MESEIKASHFRDVYYVLFMSCCYLYLKCPLKDIMLTTLSLAGIIPGKKFVEVGSWKNVCFEGHLFSIALFYCSLYSLVSLPQ